MLVVGSVVIGAREEKEKETVTETGRGDEGTRLVEREGEGFRDSFEGEEGGDEREEVELVSVGEDDESEGDVDAVLK